MGYCRSRKISSPNHCLLPRSNGMNDLLTERILYQILESQGIIVVYDVTNLESFQHIPYWFKNIDEVRSRAVSLHKHKSPYLIHCTRLQRIESQSFFVKTKKIRQRIQTNNKFSLIIIILECITKRNKDFDRQQMRCGQFTSNGGERTRRQTSSSI